MRVVDCVGDESTSTHQDAINDSKHLGHVSHYPTLLVASTFEYTLSGCEMVGEGHVILKIGSL